MARDRKNNKRIVWSLIFNILILIFEVIGTSISYSKYGVEMFLYYTVDSNVLALVASLIMTITTLLCLTKKDKLPIWVTNFKYMTTCCLTLTFIVVVAVLAPSYGSNGYEMMLIRDEMIYHHLLCPLLSIISFVLFEANGPMNYKNSQIAMIPTMLYAAILITMNILKVVVGPYPFLHVYEQPIYMSFVWFILIDGSAYIFAWLLRQATKIKHS